MSGAPLGIAVAPPAFAAPAAGVPVDLFVAPIDTTGDLPATDLPRKGGVLAGTANAHVVSVPFPGASVHGGSGYNSGLMGSLLSADLVPDEARYIATAMESVALGVVGAVAFSNPYRAAGLMAVISASSSILRDVFFGGQGIAYEQTAIKGIFMSLITLATFGVVRLMRVPIGLIRDIENFVDEAFNALAEQDRTTLRYIDAGRYFVDPDLFVFPETFEEFVELCRRRPASYVRTMLEYGRRPSYLKTSPPDAPIRQLYRELSGYALAGNDEQLDAKLTSLPTVILELTAESWAIGSKIHDTIFKVIFEQLLTRPDSDPRDFRFLWDVFDMKTPWRLLALQNIARRVEGFDVGSYSLEVVVDGKRIRGEEIFVGWFRSKELLGYNLPALLEILRDPAFQENAFLRAWAEVNERYFRREGSGYADEIRRVLDQSK